MFAFSLIMVLILCSLEGVVLRLYSGLRLDHLFYICNCSYGLILFLVAILCCAG